MSKPYNTLICAKGLFTWFLQMDSAKQTMIARTIWTKTWREGNKNLLQNGRKLITEGKYRAKMAILHV